MSVLQSTYYEELPNLDRYGDLDDEEPIQVHVAAAFFEHVHLSLESCDQITEVNMTIEHAEVVSKSYPAYWDDLKSIGFQISEI